MPILGHSQIAIRGDSETLEDGAVRKFNLRGAQSKTELVGAQQTSVWVINWNPSRHVHAMARYPEGTRGYPLN